MRILKNLFDNNVAWSEAIKQQDPDFFQKLSQQQTPDYLWIGCSDSRVPANQIVDLLPGELFVHRNVANLVIHTDLNCLSVMQFAVDVLKVKHIIVCGHYGCGGVLAALKNNQNGLIDNWLRHIKDIYYQHQEMIDILPTEQNKCDKLCEFSVRQQVANVCATTIVRDAWERNQSITVHGWVYGIQDGLLHDLEVCVASREEAVKKFGH